MSKNVIGALVIAIVGIIIGIATPWYPELPVIGHRVVMILLIAIGMWVFKPFGLPFSMGAVFLTGGLLIIGIAPGQAFAGFTGVAVWTLIPSLFFGFVVVKTGLGKRIALLMLKQFKPSVGTLLISFIIIGLILSALTPAIVVRIAIMLPIALACIEACEIKGDSRVGSLILLTVWATAMMPGNAWFTGTLWGPILQGMFDGNEALRGTVNFASWFRAATLPIALQSAFMLILGYLVFKPKEKVAIKITKEDFAQQYKDLGPMAFHEKATGLILVASFIVFLTGGIGFHNVPEAAVVLVATFLLGLTGVLKMPEISSGINWDQVVFVGTALGLGAVFAGSGVAGWISSILLTLLEPLGGSHWVLFFVVLIVLFIWRFFDIAIMLPTIAIFIPTLTYMSDAFGIDPLVWIAIFVMAANCFFMSYTNTFALFGQAINKDKGWSQPQISKYGIVYGVACLISLAISIPYWTAIGLLT